VISVITFKYRRPDYRTTYTSEHVNALAAMTARYYNHPHRFFCVTDDPEGLADGIEYVPLWPDHFNLVNPSHPTSRPNCYPRLKLFSREMAAIFGPRYVSLDLDMVMVDDVAPLWQRPEGFVIYDARGDDHYNGSMFLQTAGFHQEVWDDFDPVESPKLTTAARMRGSDQAWIRYKLAPNAAVWDYNHGVYAYLNLVPPYRHRRLARLNVVVPRNGQPKPAGPIASPVTPLRDGSLPENARVVVFAGEFKPWEPRTQGMSPWIKDHYPLRLLTSISDTPTVLPSLSAEAPARRLKYRRSRG
jgi:hypothetical protein